MYDFTRVSLLEVEVSASAPPSFELSTTILPFKTRSGAPVKVQMFGTVNTGAPLLGQSSIAAERQSFIHSKIGTQIGIGNLDCLEQTLCPICFHVISDGERRFNSFNK